MRPYKMTAQKAASKKPQIIRAITQLETQSKSPNESKENHADVLAGAEEDLWNYSVESLSGIGDYIRAREEKGIVRHTLGDGAVALVATAIEHIHHIDLRSREPGELTTSNGFVSYGSTASEPTHRRSRDLISRPRSGLSSATRFSDGERHRFPTLRRAVGACASRSAASFARR